MKFTFIFPEQSYIKGRLWCKSFFAVEPPVIAKLKSLVPKDIKCEFFDERIESINFKTKTDLVIISINTFTAYRGYKIAEEFREKGIKVAIGGLHATLCPEEAANYADCVLVGEAELTFSQMINDFLNNNMKNFYYADGKCDLQEVKLDRSIFKGKRYLPYRHVEVSRGCAYNCNFCTIAKVYEQNVSLRPVDEIIDDIKNIGVRYIGLVDENACAHLEYRKELYTKMIPLKKRWFAQMTVKGLLDEDFVELMAQCGCFNVFIGMESISRDVLDNMNKKHNIIDDYEKAIKNCEKNNISVSIGTIMGYEGDTLENAKNTFEYLNNKQLFMSIFTTFFPIPNTSAYNKLKNENKLENKKWWMNDENPFKQQIIKYSVDNDFTGVAQYYFTQYLTLKNIFKRFIKSDYKLGMRLFILWFNLFMKYNINSFG